MIKKKKILCNICIIIVIAIVLGLLLFKIKSVDKNTSEEKIQITINVSNKENEKIYNNVINVEKDKFLSDILENLDDLNVIMEDSEYGKYIVSILGIKQDNYYYWTYYINDEYANVGVSSCQVKDKTTYSFKIEKVEY